MKRLGQLFCLCLVLFTQCSWAAEVADANGQTVRLEHRAERIVSLAPHATEMLFAAGLGKRVVGVVQHSDYPPEAKKIPRIGGYDRLDMEGIVALRPDLVVAWKSGNPPRQIEHLQELGLTVYITEPRALVDISRTIRDLGKLGGTEAVAERSARAFEAHVAQLRSRYSHRPTVSVFYEIWNQPLMTINGQHLISRVIRLCGGRNVFADLTTLAGKIDEEAVLARNPEAILASGMAQSRPQWLDDWRHWPQLRAVQRNNLYFIPPDIIQRQSPRILEGAEAVCQSLEQVRAKRAETHR